eukprot:CAMPEP_0115169124 /NCGR_PEP_ID=MMETSP0270-20121206/1108_1 /TAXON_ID=71861 /ORGANISM="Scrippsiella trochoidea, Strain CCMP3099" /LENGTH=505 /DNA_ID=CAMNT_0002581815 /DNA_START=33 /DNA_END=1549 /DNA_ORIENTATION=-
MDAEDELPHKTPSVHLPHDPDYSWQESSTTGTHEKLNVAFVCTPHSGHMLPMLNIAKVVAERGHRVRILTTDYAVAQFQKQVNQIGADIEPLDMRGETHASMHEKAEAQNSIPFMLFGEKMLQPVIQSLAKDRPQVVVSDFVTIAGMSGAEESMAYLLVINFPGPLSMFRQLFDLMDSSTHVAAFGLHLARTRFSPFGLLVWANKRGFRTWALKFRHHISSGAVVLIQTIWGLDRPQPLPPNVVVTGPVLPPAGDLRQRLAADHPDLYKFLHASGLDGIVYVTTGSQAELQKWQVEEIFNGLKKAGFRVVWSLKEKQQAFLPCKDDPQFFISKWTPQAELLQDDAVKVVITHCGWGGTLETLTASKPIVTIPFFGDQPANARLLVASGVGEYIGKIPIGTESSRNPYKPGDFTAETVATAVTKIMQNPSYKKAASKLMNASRACGGADAAAQQIEWAARFGTSHLCSDDFLRTSFSHPLNGLILGALGLAACAGLLAYKRVAKSA